MCPVVWGKMFFGLGSAATSLLTFYSEAAEYLCAKSLSLPSPLLFLLLFFLTSVVIPQAAQHSPAIMPCLFPSAPWQAALAPSLFLNSAAFQEHAEFSSEWADSTAHTVSPVLLEIRIRQRVFEPSTGQSDAELKTSNSLCDAERDTAKFSQFMLGNCPLFLYCRGRY